MSYTYPSRDSRQWSCAQKGDSFGTIIGSKNIDLDDEGYVRIAPRTVKVYGNTDDADFDGVLSVHYGSNGTWWAFTNDDNFTFDVGAEAVQDSETGAFSNASDSVRYGTTMWATRTNSANLYYRSTGAWSTLGASITTSGNPHPLCVFESAQQIAVGNGSQVKLVTTPDGTPAVSGTILQIPAKFTVTTIAYADSKLYIGTKTSSGEAFMLVWNGSGTSAQYGFPVSTNFVLSIVPYQSTVALVTAQGQILRFTGNGFEQIAAFPTYYSGLDWAQGTNAVHVGHRSLVSDGDLLYVNVANGSYGRPFAFADNRDKYPDNTPAGVWVYDPAVGLYHRHSPTQSKRSILSVTTGNVNTSTDVITVTAAPATGTPVVAVVDTPGDWGDNVFNGTVYYAIKLSATTMAIAATRALAVAGTKIDITAAVGTVTLFCFPETDFGQQISERNWAVSVYRNQDDSAQFWEASRLFFGGATASATNLQASSDCLNTAVISLPNRAHFTLSKVQAEGVTEGSPTLFVRFQPLKTAEDKIVVKHRGVEKAGYPLRYVSATWVDATSFTTTDARFASVVAGEEIEIVGGRASGCLAHVSGTPALAGGTYTVTVDEAMPEVAASDVSIVNVDNWAKKTTITTSSETNAKGFAAVPVASRDAIFHQLKVEMRGADYGVREIYVPASEGRGY